MVTRNEPQAYWLIPGLRSQIRRQHTAGRLVLATTLAFRVCDACQAPIPAGVRRKKVPEGEYLARMVCHSCALAPEKAEGTR